MGGVPRSDLRGGHFAVGIFLFGITACGGNAAPASEAPLSAKRAPAAARAPVGPASPAPTSDPAPSLPADGALDFVFSVPARDAIVVGERVITIDPDFKSL